MNEGWCGVAEEEIYDEQGNGGIERITRKLFHEARVSCCCFLETIYLGTPYYCS